MGKQVPQMSITDAPVVMVLLKQGLDQLSPATKRVALYVVANAGKVVRQTALEVARNSGSSEASVVRMCKELGFKGYHDFQIQLAQDLAAESDLSIPEDILSSDTPDVILKKILAAEQEALRLTARMIDLEVFNKIVDVLSKAEKIGFFAVGSSYPLALDACWRFSKIGIWCQTQSDPSAQVMLASALGPRDVAFSISRSGQSKVPVTALQIARNSGVRTICLTQKPRSEVTMYSDYALVTAERRNHINEAATATRIAHMGLLDALYTATAIRRGRSALDCMERITKLTREQQF